MIVLNRLYREYEDAVMHVVVAVFVIAILAYLSRWFLVSLLQPPFIGELLAVVLFLPLWVDSLLFVLRPKAAPWHKSRPVGRRLLLASILLCLDLASFLTVRIMPV
jgi:hypothetical protein